jgi:hypothetical protein
MKDKTFSLSYLHVHISFGLLHFVENIKLCWGKKLTLNSVSESVSFNVNNLSLVR